MQDILKFFCNLAILNEEALHMLEAFPNFVPYLVLCLSEIANWIWEEESFEKLGGTNHQWYVSPFSVTLCIG